MDLCFDVALETGDSIERLDATAPLSLLLGRPIDRVIVTPFLGVDVVTGVQTDRPNGPTLLTSAGAWRIEHTPVSGRPDPAAIPSPRERIKAQAVEDFLDHFPLGLEGFVRGAIVSPGRVDAYTTLPGAAGLNAWLASGIAVATGREAEIALVVPVLRWPGGLGQARPLTVLLPDGVPMPAGDPGNWIILSADRSRCLAGRCPP